MATLNFSQYTIPDTLAEIGSVTHNNILDVGYLCSDSHPYFNFGGYYTAVHPNNAESATSVSVYTKSTEVTDGITHDKMILVGNGTQTGTSLSYNSSTYTYTSYENIRLYRINKYSKHKPVIAASVSSNNDGAGDAGTYGIDPTVPTSGTFAEMVEGIRYPYTLLPSPTDSNWKRLSDFNGYKSDETSFSCYPNSIEISSTDFSINLTGLNDATRIPFKNIIEAVAKKQSYTSSFSLTDLYVICMLRIENCSYDAANGTWLHVAYSSYDSTGEGIISKVGTYSDQLFSVGSIPDVFGSLDTSVTADCYVTFFFANDYSIPGTYISSSVSLGEADVELTSWYKLGSEPNYSAFGFLAPIENVIAYNVQVKGTKIVSYYSFALPAEIYTVPLYKTYVTFPLTVTGADQNGTRINDTTHQVEIVHNTYKVVVRIADRTSGSVTEFSTINTGITTGTNNYTYYFANNQGLNGSFTLEEGHICTVIVSIYVEKTIDGGTVWSELENFTFPGEGGNGITVAEG